MYGAIVTIITLRHTLEEVSLSGSGRGSTSFVQLSTYGLGVFAMVANDELAIQANFRSLRSVRTSQTQKLSVLPSIVDKIVVRTEWARRGSLVPPYTEPCRTKGMKRQRTEGPAKTHNRTDKALNKVDGPSQNSK